MIKTFFRTQRQVATVHFGVNVAWSLIFGEHEAPLKTGSYRIPRFELMLVNVLWLSYDVTWSNYIEARNIFIYLNMIMEDNLIILWFHCIFGTPFIAIHCSATWSRERGTKEMKNAVDTIIQYTGLSLVDALDKKNMLSMRDNVNRYS